MKLGDNGEAFFVEETEEEYVSSNGSCPFCSLYSGFWCISQNRNIQFSWLVICQKGAREMKDLYSMLDFRIQREFRPSYLLCFNKERYIFFSNINELSYLVSITVYTLT